MLKTVSYLADLFEQGEIEVLSLGGGEPRNIERPPVSWHIDSYRSSYSALAPDKITFTASRYVGVFSDVENSIEIGPRFGDEIFSHILGYATGVYLAPGTGNLSMQASGAAWLSCMLWKGLLSRALAQGDVPKEYKAVQGNLRHFRGKLLLQKHISQNITDASRFYCSYRRLSSDTAINRTILATALHLIKTAPAALTRGLRPLADNLVLQGVHSQSFSTGEIDRINYTRLNIRFRPLMSLSRAILKGNDASTDSDHDSTKSFFIDMAELWEEYLLAVLKRGLAEEYRVYSPNHAGGEWLLENGHRQIRPDIIIEKQGRPIAIIDAKYKDYTHLGRYDTKTDPLAVSRDDLYQMTTYLHHYQPIFGLFVSPVAQTDHYLHPFTNSPNQKIGLLNLDIENCGSLQNLQNMEEAFIKRVRNLLLLGRIIS